MGQLTDAITPKAPINIQVPVRPEVIINDAALEDIKQKIVITGEQISAALETTLENAAINFGELLGSTLTGGADIGDFFDSLFGQIGAGLKQLGQYFIKTAIEIKIFKEFATKYPLLALAAGVALVALGSVIQNSTAKKKAFAVGGRVPGTGNTDSVDAILTPGEFVIRKSSAQALGADNLSLLNQGIVPSGVSIGAGEQLIRVVGETVVAGNDLRIILNRANATYGRNA